MLAVQLKSAVTMFGGKGATGLPRVAFELEVRDQVGRRGGTLCLLLLPRHRLFHHLRVSPALQTPHSHIADNNNNSSNNNNNNDDDVVFCL